RVAVPFVPAQPLNYYVFDLHEALIC
ncbi:MAG: hypothetical protein RL109_303, partial [Pseudomonadota bacterium]